MSLTGILSGTGHQELRTKFKEEFPRPKIQLVGNLDSPPLTKNYGAIGTAFDYIFRAYLERQFIKRRPKGVYLSKSNWVSESIVNHLAQNGGKNTLVRTRQGDFKSSDYIEEAVKIISTTKELQAKYLESGELCNEFFESCLKLSKIDLIGRAGIFEDLTAKIDKNDILDLASLCKNIPEQSFFANQRIILNPSFGEGSILVGGADADFIIDDMLVDIKVSKSPKIHRDYLNQLIGYHLLSLIGGINGKQEVPKVKKFGIYFARFSTLWTIPIEMFGSDEKFLEMSKWLKDYINHD